MGSILKGMIYWAVALLLTACGSGSKNDSTSAYINANENNEIIDLPLPVVPDSLHTVESRAGFVALHYWDALDFRNRQAVDTPFIEQNFSNYIAILEMASREAASKGVSDLLRRASAVPAAFDLLNHTAERYLDDPNSPMRNEEIYILFLQALTNASYLDDELKLRPQMRLETALKNRPGTIASNFNILLRDGSSTTMHNFAQQADTTLMVFYDPECEHCTEVIAKLAMQPLQDGWQVLAVDFTGNSDRWQRTKGEIPPAWTDSYALTHDLDGELYSIPATPTLYLLDRHSRVLLKDPPLPR